MSKYTVLVTNDDGIDSFFLHVLVKALLKEFKVFVAAPMAEQSWIGRAISRNRTVHLTEYHEFDCPAWALDGTPSDCVNIAMGHLLEKKPDTVISGINIKHNITLPLLLSSGTLGGAIEGVSWGIPGIALSQDIPKSHPEHKVIRQNHGKTNDPALLQSIQYAADHASQFAKKCLSNTSPQDPFIVQNVNYPILKQPKTPEINTSPAHLPLGSLFKQETKTSYKFSYPTDLNPKIEKGTDLHALLNGFISITPIRIRNF